MKYPKADIKGYAIWFNMYPGDSRADWPPDVVTDPRVMHRWDEAKLIGSFFGQNKSRIQAQLSSDSRGLGRGEILWDAYLLYGQNAKWESFPTGLLRVGRTIIAGRETLKRDMQQLFGQ